MGKPATRKHRQPPTCDLCGEPLETAATAQNPSATIMPNILSRCPSCLALFVIGDDLRPSEDLSIDEVAFNAAMNASHEVKEWALKTLEAARIRVANEIKAECVAAREWLVARSDHNAADNLAILDAYAAGFDEQGRNSVSPGARFRAITMLSQIRRRRH